ncbi:hypothetical protein IKQ02_05035 [bacterium]|nr:hypothetical protein [bacterium]
MKNRPKSLLNIIPISVKLLIISGIFVISTISFAPSYGWFSYIKSTLGISRIENPTSINITSGKKESYMCIELAGLDLSDESGYKDFVFGVSGLNVKSYRFQLAYTTNNQLNYSIYHAVEGSRPGNEIGYVDYYSHDGLNTLTTYYIPSNSSLVSGNFLNTNSSATLATNDPNDEYYEKTYDDYDYVNEFAMPIYWQSELVMAGEEEEGTDTFFDYYILRVSWDGVRQNNKETDIIYITARNESA